MQSRRLSMLGFVLAMGVLGTVATADMKVLFYEYEKSLQHFFNVTKREVTQAGGETIKYELTTNAQKELKLDNLKKYDMVLFGTHGIGGWSTYHLEGVEEDLIKYVDGDEGEAKTNVILVENAVNYFVKRVKEVRSVEPANKLRNPLGSNQEGLKVYQIRKSGI